MAYRFAKNNNLKYILNLELPFSAYISQVFNFVNFANLEPFAKLFQRKFWHLFTSNLSWLHIGDVKDGSLSVLQEGGWRLSRTKLSNSQGVLWKEVPHLRYPQQTQKLLLYFRHQLPVQMRSGDHTSRSVLRRRLRLDNMQQSTEH